MTLTLTLRSMLTLTSTLVQNHSNIYINIDNLVRVNPLGLPLTLWSGRPEGMTLTLDPDTDLTLTLTSTLTLMSTLRSGSK